MRKNCSGLSIHSAPLCSYGNLEAMIRALRDHRPLDLNAESWRAAHPGGTFEQWRAQAAQCLLDGLHYDPGPLDLKSETLGREERDGFILEHVAFNTAPWIRVSGLFLLPKGDRYPVPGLVVFHEWGGPMLFGKERVVNTGRDHPALREHRASAAGGKYLAEEFARRGYAVIVIDAHHFGARLPRGVGGIPADLDPFSLPLAEFRDVEQKARELLYLGVRQLNWAGTTWMGLNYWDDSRCVDYLRSRPEVDPARIGCTGLSGGGWRTNMLAALDRRVRASVSVGWMTTGDYQQLYNVSGAIGTFCLLPGVWDRLDVPDLTVMSAPCAGMVIVGTKDELFPVEGVQEAVRQIRSGYEWAGCPGEFSYVSPIKIHCYDADVQREAIRWLDWRLKAREPFAKGPC